jgi:hypothetical protein
MDIKILKQKYYNKKVNAEKEKIDFKLSFNEFKILAEQANITDVDMSIKGYHLARNNDSGAYEVGNCRFIYYKENYKEKKVSDKVRETSKVNVKKAYEELNGKNKLIYQKKAIDGKNKWWDSMSDEDKKVYLSKYSLTEKEIKRRHDIIMKIPDRFGRLTKAAKIIGVEPAVVGRFLKKYPLPI